VAAVLAGVFGDPSGPNLSLADAREEYLAYARVHKRASTLGSDEPRLDVIAKEPWAKGPMHRIRSEDIARFIDGLMSKGHRGKPCSAATAQRYHSVVSAMLKWAMRRGYVKMNPARGIERPRSAGKDREVYLTPEEARALVDAASDLFRPLVVFALGTGCRRGEILALQWRDVDLEKGEVRVRAENSKTRAGRSIPVPVAVRTALEAVRGSQDVRQLDREDHAFQLPDGEPWTPGAVRKEFEAAVERCKALPSDKAAQLRFHDLRHTYASVAVQAGVPIHTVSRMLGHASLHMTMRYAHLCPDDRRKAADAIGAALALDADRNGKGATKGANAPATPAATA
jgi:integrase